MEHALLAPSSAHRWLKCTRSARLEEKIPSKSSIWADEGTLAHDLATIWLRYSLGEIDKYQKAAKEMEITRHELYKPEMDQHVNDYVQFCLGVHEKMGKDTWTMVEQKFDLSKWVPESWGHSDFSIVGKNTLHIIDFKYGQGVPVSADGNTQLQLYALGVARIAAWFQDIEWVKMSIFQPRLNNISTAQMHITGLVSWAENTLKPKANVAFNGKGDFVAGDHCRFCRVKSSCKALAAYNSELEKFEYQSPDLLTAQQIAEILTKADMFTNWLNSVVDYATDQAKRGKTYPGWKLIEATGRSVIKDQNRAIASLLKTGYKKDEIIDYKLKSLTELHKLLAKGEYHTLLKDYVIKPPGTPKLVPVTDKRPAIKSIQSAVEDFKHLKL